MAIIRSFLGHVKLYNLLLIIFKNVNTFKGCFFLKKNRLFYTYAPGESYLIEGVKTKKINLPNKETFEMIYECSSYDLDEITQIYLNWWYFNTFYNFGIDKTITKDTMNDFFANLKDTPFMSCCVEEVRNILHRIFKPEDEMLLEGYDYNFLHKQLGRGKELLYMKIQNKTVQQDLGIIFVIKNYFNFKTRITVGCYIHLMRVVSNYFIY